MEKHRIKILENVLQVVSEESGVPIADIVGPSVKRLHSDARKIFCYVVKNHIAVPFTLYEIGSMINRDHTSVINNKAMASNLIADKYFNKILTAVTTRVVVADYADLTFDYNNIPQL